MILKFIQNGVFHSLNAIKLLPCDIIHPHQVDSAFNVAKHLEEYRALIENIEKRTGYFSSEAGRWSKEEAITQDDYLIKLFTLRYNELPTDNHLSQCPLCVRARPTVFNESIEANKAPAPMACKRFKCKKVVY